MTREEAIEFFYRLELESSIEQYGEDGITASDLEGMLEAAVKAGSMEKLKEIWADDHADQLCEEQYYDSTTTFEPKVQEALDILKPKEKA